MKNTIYKYLIAFFTMQEKISVNDNLSEAYLMITCGSSTIFEAGKLGVIPLLIFDKDKNCLD